jgi:hypothetical protein
VLVDANTPTVPKASPWATAAKASRRSGSKTRPGCGSRVPVIDPATAKPEDLRRIVGKRRLFRVVIDSLPEERAEGVLYDLKGGDAANGYTAVLHAEADADELLVEGRLEVIEHRGSALFPAWAEWRLLSGGDMVQG